MTTKIVHCQKESYTVYIGRPSKWGNPFKAGVHGSRAEVLSMYREYIMSTPELKNSLHELDGETLACWCKPKSCHGDVLVELIEEGRLDSFEQD